MDRFTPGAPGGDDPAGPPDEQATDLSSLLNYPSIGALFDQPNSPALAEMRARLARTNQELERVIRQGSKEDADRATSAARACAVALSVLAELEELARGGAGGARR